ncbi:MAG: hypothetical protein AseanaTS_18470 [Candidatus Pelagadaptatus aseana]
MDVLARSQISLRILKIVGSVAVIGSLFYLLAVTHYLRLDFEREYNRSLARFVKTTADRFEVSFYDRRAQLLALAHDLEASYRNPDAVSRYWDKGSKQDLADKRFKVDVHSSVFIPKQLAVTEDMLDEIAYTGSAWGASERQLGRELLSLSFISDTGFLRTQPLHRASLMAKDFDPRSSDLFVADTKDKDGSNWFVLLDPLNNEFTMTVTQKVMTEDRQRGVLVGVFDMPYGKFNRLTQVTNEFPVQLLLTDKDNRLLASSVQLQLLEEATPNTDLTVESIAAVLKDYPGPQYEGAVDQWHIPGSGKYHLVTVAMNGTEWSMIGLYPDSFIDDRLLRINYAMLVFMIAGALILTVISYQSLQHYISLPLKKLLAATQKIPMSDWHYNAPTLKEDEVGELSHAIDDLATNLRRTINSHQKTISSLDAMSKSLSSMYSTLDASGNLTAIMEPDWELIFANETFLDLFGADLGHGDFREIYRGFFPQLGAGHFQEVEDALKTHGIWQNEIHIESTDDGSTKNFLEKIFYQTGEEGDIVSIIYSAQALFQSGETSAEIQRLAYYDHLTGLQNRTFFKGVMEKELNALNRSESMLALLYLDLDNFKTINDSLGHDAGDELLIEVAGRLQECLRNEDAVARLGGDEFAILLTDVDVLHYVSIVANKILKALSQPMHLTGQLIEVQASIGVTIAPHDGVEVQELMKNADLAMYQAKAKGKNNFRFFTRDMNQQVSRRLALEQEVKSALENHEFVLFYQPKVHLKSGGIHSAEALIRWRLPSGEFRSPAEFIPAAEDSGLIDELGVWIMKTACQQAKTLYKALRQEVVISINVSARQLLNPAFVSQVGLAINEVNLKPSLLELEITESLFMSNLEQNIHQLDELRALGVRVSIDDFGTGYSSLSYLKRLPIDQLKIDRSFIMDLPDDEDDRVISELIISMAQRLSLEVVAEGVETREQYEYLDSLECEYIQGFYFAKPLPADEFMKLIFEVAKQPRGIFSQQH